MTFGSLAQFHIYLLVDNICLAKCNVLSRGLLHDCEISRTFVYLRLKPCSVPHYNVRVQVLCSLLAPALGRQLVVHPDGAVTPVDPGR